MKYCFLLGLMFLTSCGSQHYVIEPISVDSIPNERYCDPRGWYSLDIPREFDSKAEEKNTETMSCVIFYDDIGGLIRFEVYPFTKENYNDICTLESSREALLRGLFYECVFLPIQTQIPETTVTHAEFVIMEEDEEALFAVLKIPSGGTLVNVSTGKREDSTRGYLLFFRKRQLVLISIQPSPIYPCENIEKILLRKLIHRAKFYRNEQE